MNWVERLYEIKNKDLYAQNGEGLILEHIYESANCSRYGRTFIDIGGGDGVYLSNTRHLANIGFQGFVLDLENDYEVNIENVCELVGDTPQILSIDVDGNDYYLLEMLFKSDKLPQIIVAEFNAAFTDSRTVKYNHRGRWDGSDYYGFSFEAGKKLFEANGYKVVFQTGNMNMFAVRSEYCPETFPEVTYQQNEFFRKSDKTDWIFV